MNLTIPLKTFRLPVVEPLKLNSCHCAAATGSSVKQFIDFIMDNCQIVIGSLVCDSAKLHNDTLIIMETLAKEFETLSTNDPDSPQ
ncbi:hypothetical protein ACU8KH_06673 [Lachancea thermotolerans]